MKIAIVHDWLVTRGGAELVLDEYLTASRFVSYKRVDMIAAAFRHVSDRRLARGLESGLDETVRWYLDNEAWWKPLVKPT